MMEEGLDRITMQWYTKIFGMAGFCIAVNSKKPCSKKASSTTQSRKNSSIKNAAYPLLKEQNFISYYRPLTSLYTLIVCASLDLDIL